MYFCKKKNVSFIMARPKKKAIFCFWEEINSLINTRKKNKSTARESMQNDKKRKEHISANNCDNAKLTIQTQDLLSKCAEWCGFKYKLVFLIIIPHIIIILFGI